MTINGGVPGGPQELAYREAVGEVGPAWPNISYGSIDEEVLGPLPPSEGAGQETVAVVDEEAAYADRLGAVPFKTRSSLDIYGLSRSQTAVDSIAGSLSGWTGVPRQARYTVVGLAIAVAGALLVAEAFRRLLRQWRLAVAGLRLRHRRALAHAKIHGLQPVPESAPGAFVGLPGRRPPRGTSVELRDLGWKVRTLEEIEGDVELEILIALHMAIVAKTQGQRKLDSLLHQLGICELSLQKFVTELYPAPGRSLTSVERFLYMRMRDKMDAAARSRKYR